MFWKDIYVLLHAVFPVLKALLYCDPNTPSMVKIYHLAKRAEDAILKSVHELDDEKFLYPQVVCSAATAGCDDEVEEIFGSHKERESNDNERNVSFQNYFSCLQIIFSKT